MPLLESHKISLEQQHKYFLQCIKILKDPDVRKLSMPTKILHSLNLQLGILFITNISQEKVNWNQSGNYIIEFATNISGNLHN